MCTFAGNFCSSSVFWHFWHRFAPPFLTEKWLDLPSCNVFFSLFDPPHFSRFSSLLPYRLKKPTRFSTNMASHILRYKILMCGSKIFPHLNPKCSYICIQNSFIFRSDSFSYLNSKYFYIWIQDIFILGLNIWTMKDLLGCE